MATAAYWRLARWPIPITRQVATLGVTDGVDPVHTCPWAGFLCGRGVTDTRYCAQPVAYNAAIALGRAEAAPQDRTPGPNN
jgi:hypothetical protein